MEDYQKLLLEQKMKLKRGAAIIEGTQDKFRQDGYSNMLTKYGTSQDNSTAYTYQGEVMTDDIQLTNLYAGNGLFANIIDRPSEEAVKHGLDIDFDEEISEYVEEKLDDLDYEDKFATAQKWARLYGGAIIVMLVDDGKDLVEPLDWDAVRRIEELHVYERPLVQLDYPTLYNKTGKIGEPEYYHVSSIYGSFTVHRSRCLTFRNSKMPERIMSQNYRYWGVPEYDRIKRELRECTTSHGDGVKLLERSVQAIYSMNNLSNMLATEEGENKVLQRLQVIDMARSILNSIAIDNDGEQYRYETLSLAGVKDVIDSTCNMLSAVTKIPQTILFGRSPAGMNSTGESDFENYYNMVEGIQKQNMKKNTRTIIYLILRQGMIEGAIKEIPRFKMKFAALWSSSEAEQAGIDKTKADTEYVRAQTEQIYMETNVLDPTDVRNSLAQEGRYDLEEESTDNDLNLPDDTFDLGIDTPITVGGIEGDFSVTDAVNKAFKEAEDDNIISVDCPSLDEEDTNIHIRVDGSDGSGNWGHDGVPGHLGGSASGGGIKNRLGTKESGFTSEAKKMAEEKKKEKANKKSMESNTSSKEKSKDKENNSKDKQKTSKNATQQEKDDYKRELNPDGDCIYDMAMIDNALSNVSYNIPKELSRELSENEIIQKLSGADETGGSCVSLAYSYVANKYCNLDVTDKKGGESREFFSKSSNAEDYFNAEISTVGIGVGYSPAGKLASDLDGKIKKGEEYILRANAGNTGHCAIVRKNAYGNIEYLEMQSPSSSGNKWVSTNKRTAPIVFGQRFNLNSGNELSYSLQNCKDVADDPVFRYSLGYINTK